MEWIGGFQGRFTIIYVALQNCHQRSFEFFTTQEKENDHTAFYGGIRFNADETQKRLQLAILSLPEKQRVVFNLKYFEEMKYEDMAEILNTSVGALKASFHLAVKKIENFLNEG